MRSRSRLVIVFAVAAALVVIAGCSGGGGKKSHTTTPTTDAGGNTPVALTLGQVTVDSYGPTVKMPSSTQKAALADAQAYVDAAMLTPYDTGALGKTYPALFDKGVRDDAVRSDLGVLTDAKVGKAKYTAKATPVVVSGLADSTGKFVFLATRFTVTANLTTAEGPIAIRRDVELTFAPAGKNWTVVAYRADMTRKLPSGATTTTSVASSGSTP